MDLVANENEGTPPEGPSVSRRSSASSPCPPTPTRPKSRSPFAKQKNKPRRMSEQTKLSVHFDEEISDGESKMSTSFSVPDLRIIPADGEVDAGPLSSRGLPEVPLTPIRVVRYKTNVNPYSPSRGHPTASKEILIPTEKGEVPRFVSDFEDHGEIGKGSFSNVILCLNRIDGWTYAIKKLIYQSEKMKDKYLKEAYALAALGQHENIVRYYGSWEDTSCNAIYIQTEWCKGGCLKNHISSFNQNELQKVISQVSKALSFMHETGLPHGDVKPENVLVDTTTILPSTTYKLCDLGQINESGDGKYLAPEVLNYEDISNIEKHLIGRADVFSLGMTVYELAYERVTNSQLPVKQRSQITPEDINLPSDHFTAEFVQLLRDMMHRDPNLRPSALQVLKHPLIRTDIEWQLEQESKKVAVLLRRVEELEKELKRYQGGTGQVLPPPLDGTFK